MKKASNLWRRAALIIVCLSVLSMNGNAGQSTFEYQPNNIVSFSIEDGIAGYAERLPVYRVEKAAADAAKLALTLGFDLNEYTVTDYESVIHYNRPDSEIIISVDSGFLNAQRGDGERLFKLASYFYSSEYGAYTDEIHDRSELEEMSEQEAQASAAAALRELGFDDFEYEIDVYPLHLEDIRKAAIAYKEAFLEFLGEGYELDEEEEKSLIPPQFAKEDECYLASVTFSQNQVPLIRRDVTMKGRGLHGSSGVMLLAADGLRLIRVNGAIYLRGEEITPDADMLPVTQICDRFADFYEDVMVDKIQIDQMQLNYMAMPYNRNEYQAELRPIWILRRNAGANNTDECGNQYSWKYVDAYTGDVYDIMG